MQDASKPTVHVLPPVAGLEDFSIIGPAPGRPVDESTFSGCYRDLDGRICEVRMSWRDAIEFRNKLTRLLATLGQPIPTREQLALD